MSKVYKIKNNFNTLPDFTEETFFCNLCGFMLNSENDIQHHSEHGCCYECYLTFGESRKTLWEKGWRPKKREIGKYITNRKRLIINTTKKEEL